MIEVTRYTRHVRIAYFTMEIGIRPEMHTYSGGLGILAGDAARSAADLDLPMVFVTLASRAGYLRQELDAEGIQTDNPDPWNPEDYAQPVGAMIALTIEGRAVWIRPWLYELKSELGQSVPIILLDTNVSENAAQDRSITDRLYGGGDADRLKQEIVLGIGGERMLRALGFNIATYHLNEGHAALLPLSLLLRHPHQPIPELDQPLTYDIDQVREACVFTTHTPIEAGHDRFSYDIVQPILGNFIEIDQLKLLAGADVLNMTQLALRLSGYVNGVARRHAETTQHMFPAYHVRAVTNGAHVKTWMHRRIAELFEKGMPALSYEPEMLLKADDVSADAIWAAHQEAKHEMLVEIEHRTGVVMRPDVVVIGFARRMTGYKRLDLLFSDLARLRGIHAHYPIQIVIAGKAHPRDHEGKQLIRNLHAHVRELKPMKIAFISNYNMEVSAKLVSGADIWLNTPLPPLEASGTSGMKAGFNGVLNLSVLDGWWLEGWDEGVTGWAIGRDGSSADAVSHSHELYDKLENVVLPLYYNDRARWIWMMKQSIAKIGSVFNSQRMMRRYATEAYVHH